MRGDDDVLVPEDRVLGHRLVREDVERRARPPCPTQRRLERLEVDQLAAGAVDDPHAVLHLRDQDSASIQLTVSGGLREVDR